MHFSDFTPSQYYSTLKVLLRWIWCVISKPLLTLTLQKVRVFMYPSVSVLKMYGKNCLMILV